MVNIIRKLNHKRTEAGQALVEYALILALLAIAMAIALSATGPAIANVFSNVICNVAGQSTCGVQIASLDEHGNPADFWATVTWVASNPQVRPVYPTIAPLTPTLQPTSGAAPVVNTPRPTDLPPPPPPLQPTATLEDIRFPVDFLESGNPSTATNWRLDNSAWLGGDDWVGRYYPSNNFTGSATVLRMRDVVGPQAALALDFNYGAGAPLASPWTLTDNFSIRWTRKVEVTGSLPVTFRLNADERASVRICNTEADAIAAAAACTVLIPDGATGTANTTISGTRWVSVSYVEQTGNANISLNISTQGVVNSSDTVPSGGSCNWGRLSNQDVNSLDWMWDENPNGDNWPANQTCYLELRGYVDIAGVSDPTLSFLDVWDLPAGTNARIEVGAYNADRSLISWQPINIRTGAANFRNYQWTRNQISLSTISGLGSRVALRFVLTSGSGGTPVRWYLDDIEIKSQPARTFTVNNRYSMDASGDRDAFFASGRWLVTNTRTFSGSGWELNPGPNFSQSAAVSGGPRVHYLELSGLVDLRASSGTPTTDFEGDIGVPTISFYHSYEAAPGVSLEIQYTRDTRDTTPDTWAFIPVGTSTPPEPSGQIINNTGTSTLSNPSMVRTEIRLNQIPNWDTQPFRLRLAMVVPAAASSTSRWWVDQIAIERFGGDRFTAYPLIDGAQNTTFTSDNWVMTGAWGVQTGAGTFEGTSSASPNFYSDSPSGNFTANRTTTMTMSRFIDLFYDTPLNLNNPTTIGEPVPSGAYSAANRRSTNARPTLVFWHKRDVRAGVTFAVDMTTKTLDDNNPATDTDWRQIWTYVAPASDGTGYNRWRQDAWERIEIDLRQALITATGSNFDTLLASAANDDDDIKIRFRLVTGSNTDEGVYIDGIRIEDLQRPVHRLWSGSPVAGSALAGQSVAGSGAAYSDNVDGASPSTLLVVQDRWYLDGDEWEPRSSGRAGTTTGTTLGFEDSPGGNYNNDAFNILEQQTIMDLRGITTAQNPTLVYFQRYEVGNLHRMVVQVSQSDAAQTTQDLGRTAGWSTWTDVTSNSYYNEMTNAERLGWQRIQVSLNAYVGRQIKLRWVTDAMNGSGSSDAGWQVDDISFLYNGSGAGTTTAIALPFTASQSASISRWIPDGRWGQTFDWFNPATESQNAGAQSLGSTSWIARWGNCEILNAAGSGGCGWWEDTYTALNVYWPMPAANATTVSALSTTAGTTATRTTFANNLEAASNSIRVIVDQPNWDAYNDPPYGIMNGLLYGDPTYRGNMGGRFMRPVSLAPGTYVIQGSWDRAFRLQINNGAGTNYSGTPATIIDSDDWFQEEDIQTTYLTVNSAVNRVLVGDFFADGEDNHVFLNIGRLGSSFSDSPNWNGTSSTFSVVNSINPSKTSLMLNGFFNTSSVTNPTLRFSWIARQNANTRLFVDVSTDGGFTWTTDTSTPASWNTGNTRFPGQYTWQPQAVTLPQAASVMIRFRYNTGSDTSDGVYITDIAVQSG